MRPNTSEVGDGAELGALGQLGVLGQEARGVPGRERLPADLALLELGLVDQEVDRVAHGVDDDPVALVHEGDRATVDRFRRDVPDAEPVRAAGEAPVGDERGVGPATQEKLVQRGFRTIADLQRADEIELMKQFPSDGRRLWRLARGIDDRRVVPDRGAKTVSNETTFDSDIRDFATLEKVLWRLSEKVSARLKSADLAGSTITLKLKTADFRQRTRAQSIAAPTQLASKIFAICRDMLAKEIDGTAFRLMGAGVSALGPGSAANDTDMLDRRAAHAERAIDDLRRKFGQTAVIRGIAYDGPAKPE